MVIREIRKLENGFFERVEGTSNWYYFHFSTDSCIDLYDAEEIINRGERFSGNSCALIHYPDGKVFKPFEMRENIYIEKPVFVERKIYFLEVDFDKKIMKLIYLDEEDLLKYDSVEKNSLENTKHVETEINLSEIEDCYNLMLKISPIMITRNGKEGTFEIIYPEKRTYKICEKETFDFKNGDDMYFSSWDEENGYEDLIVIRDYESGEIKNIEKGSIFRMPNGEMWKLDY